jgi:hypothetical protein
MLTLRAHCTVVYDIRLSRTDTAGGEDHILEVVWMKEAGGWKSQVEGGEIV